MKPSQIFDVLNLARKARQQGNKFNPLFVGAPGIGKSEIIQQWCKTNDLPFIDIRAAYLEAPDVIGFPQIKEVDGRARTVHALPDFWPSNPEWEGVILLEEPNRGTTSVMNTFMQMLTDHKIHLYNLPKKAIIVGAINPETEDMDVNTMDPALKNRFEIFEVEYDQSAFLAYMDKAGWDERISHFVRGGFWNYQTPESVSSNTGSKYISPRSFSKLNAALKAGLTEHNELIQMTVLESILGKNYGMQFFNFISKERPVFVSDLLENYKDAIARLRTFARPDDYKNGHISMLVEDVKKNESLVNNELLTAVCLALPADQSVYLIREVSWLRKLTNDELLKSLCSTSKDLKAHLQSNLKAEKKSK